MKFVKVTSILLFSLLFMCAITPQLSAKRHSYSSFSLNFNVDPRPRYVEYNYVYPAPAYVVRPYTSYYYEPPVYYAPREVVVRPHIERGYVERGYVHPHYSYWRY